MTFSKHVTQKWLHKDDDHYKNWLHFCPAICRLVLKGRRCDFKIACEENFELEEHPEKRTFLIIFFYINSLLS